MKWMQSTDNQFASYDLVYKLSNFASIHDSLKSIISVLLTYLATNLWKTLILSIFEKNQMNLFKKFSIILSLHCLAIDVTISESDNDGKILFCPIDPSNLVCM